MKCRERVSMMHEEKISSVGDFPVFLFASVSDIVDAQQEGKVARKNL